MDKMVLWLKSLADEEFKRVAERLEGYQKELDDVEQALGKALGVPLVQG